MDRGLAMPHRAAYYFRHSRLIILPHFEGNRIVVCILIIVAECENARMRGSAARRD